MGKGKSKKKSTGSALLSGKKKGLPVFAVVAAVLLVIVAAVVLYVGRKAGHKAQKETVTTEAPVKAKAATSDINKLLGRWLRPDGGYVLQITKILANGRLDARYLNPRPINVSVAEASHRKDGLRVFIELKDTGYPGSTYTLLYDSQRDILSGTYFQAAVGQAFDVMFVRMK